jgi:hypothetical protein
MRFIRSHGFDLCERQTNHILVWCLKKGKLLWSCMSAELAVPIVKLSIGGFLTLMKSPSLYGLEKLQPKGMVIIESVCLRAGNDHINYPIPTVSASDDSVCYPKTVYPFIS